MCSKNQKVLDMSCVVFEIYLLGYAFDSVVFVINRVMW